MGYLMKHAYLIMAHGSWKVLKMLIQIIDNEKNDIFLHIDKKVKSFPNVEEWLFHSRLIVVNSCDVKWASFSQTECEIALLEKAVSFDEYSYYHLLSGVDMPLKPAEDIYSFFENSGRKNFIAINAYERSYSFRRIAYYHNLVELNAFRNSKLLKVIDRVLEYGQRIIGINRLRDKDIIIVDGWTWFSITGEFAKYVLSQKELISELYKLTIASDEIFLQTIAFNSAFFNTLYDTKDLKKGSMRLIDWDRGKPYTWGNEEGDFEALLNSPYMFARKFDEDHMDIVNQLFNELTRRNGNDQ